MSIDNSLPSPSPETPLPKPQSHKQKRQSKNIKHTFDNEAVTTAIIAAFAIPRALTPPPAPEMTSLTTRLLIASIGNPAPYLSTLHSAGHTLLHALAASLSQNPSISQPPLRKSGREWAYGLVSQGAEYTLWQSPVSMNISGTALAAAWRTFSSSSSSSSAMKFHDSTASASDTALVVLHDELEAPLGSVVVRSGAASPKGHNGLKSIRDRMPGVKYTRIGIGIGRPASREPEVVAGYVLRKMTGAERGVVEGCVGRVEGELGLLARGG
jgi:peptidyl-tRNA hydrolase, PTH1 family